MLDGGVFFITGNGEWALRTGFGVGEGWGGGEGVINGRGQEGALLRGYWGKTKGLPGMEGPLEIKSWRCSTFPRKNAQYHRRWRA